MSTIEHTRALAALRELQTAKDLLPAVEVARRARAILDRADFKPFTVVDFLTGEGYSGPALYFAAASFGTTLSAAYKRAHGVSPLRVERFVEHLGQTRRVCEYLGVDLPLVRETFESWMRGVR